MSLNMKPYEQIESSYRALLHEIGGFQVTDLSELQQQSEVYTYLPDSKVAIPSRKHESFLVRMGVIMREFVELNLLLNTKHDIIKRELEATGAFESASVDIATQVVAAYGYTKEDCLEVFNSVLNQITFH